MSYISNSDYTSLSGYSHSVPIPQEWLYQYRKREDELNKEYSELKNKSKVQPYKDTSISNNPYSNDSYGEFNVYTSQLPLPPNSIYESSYGIQYIPKNGINPKVIDEYPQIYKTCQNNDAYQDMMIFRTVDNLENLQHDPQKNKVQKELQKLKTQYNGEQRNIRHIGGINGISFKRGEFARDHSTMVNH